MFRLAVAWHLVLLWRSRWGESRSGVCQDSGWRRGCLCRRTVRASWGRGASWLAFYSWADTCWSDFRSRRSSGCRQAPLSDSTSGLHQEWLARCQIDRKCYPLSSSSLCDYLSFCVWAWKACPQTLTSSQPQTGTARDGSLLTDGMKRLRDRRRTLPASCTIRQLQIRLIGWPQFQCFLPAHQSAPRSLFRSLTLRDC